MEGECVGEEPLWRAYCQVLEMQDRCARLRRTTHHHKNSLRVLGAPPQRVALQPMVGMFPVHGSQIALKKGRREQWNRPVVCCNNGILWCHMGWRPRSRVSRSCQAPRNNVDPASDIWKLLLVYSTTGVHETSGGTRLLPKWDGNVRSHEFTQAS